jgi:hypothetical protein
MDDVSIFNGKYYVPFPPVPALLLTPWVLIMGAGHASSTPLALLLMGLSVVTLAQILRKLGLDWDRACWVLMAFFLGTGYWYVLNQNNGVWFLAHIVAVCFVLLSIDAAQDGRAAWAGLALGCAILSRQMSVYSSLFVVALLLQGTKSVRIGARRFAAFALPLSLCVAAYLAFNWARFGSPLDCGYAHLQHGGPLKERFEQHGLFSPAYLVHNLIYMFLQGPHVEFSGLMPVDMDAQGTSLLFASPFVLLAVLARPPKLLLWAAWISIGLTLFGLLFYYNNGWTQVNTQRFTLDFMPVLIVLVGMAARDVDIRLLRVSAGYSVVLNTLALLVIPLIPRVAIRLGLV